MPLKQIVSNIQQHEPLKIPGDQQEAAVLIPITREEEPKLIVTRRALHLDKHPGEFAFPGGKKDPEDSDLLCTALREAEEEIAMDPSMVEIIGPLDQIISYHGYKVTPYVGIVEKSIPVYCASHETDLILQVPFDFFKNQQTYFYRVKEFKGFQYRSHHFIYQSEHDIWGLTAVMIINLMNIGINLNIDIGPRYNKARTELS
jgi:8-oxo-dGTP pyrophosphatase MutT (NUDIX family)